MGFGPTADWPPLDLAVEGVDARWFPREDRPEQYFWLRRDSRYVLVIVQASTFHHLPTRENMENMLRSLFD